MARKDRPKGKATDQDQGNDATLTEAEPATQAAQDAAAQDEGQQTMNAHAETHSHTNGHTAPAEVANPPATVTIQGLEFTTSMPYSPGHVLTEHEASALNQTRSENLRNNFASRVKKALEDLQKANPERADLTTADLDLGALATEFAAYEASYSFAQRHVRAPSDPVEHEAQKLGKARILAALRERKIDIKSVTTDAMTGYVAALLAKRPEIREEAKRRVDAARSIGASVLDDLGVSV